MGLFKLNLHFTLSYFNTPSHSILCKKTMYLNENGFPCVGGPWAAGKELQRIDLKLIESLLGCDSERDITTSHIQTHMWRTAALL